VWKLLGIWGLRFASISKSAEVNENKVLGVLGPTKECATR
jgi:hypothetical protein